MAITLRNVISVPPNMYINVHLCHMFASCTVQIPLATNQLILISTCSYDHPSMRIQDASTEKKLTVNVELYGQALSQSKIYVKKCSLHFTEMLISVRIEG